MKIFSYLSGFYVFLLFFFVPHALASEEVVYEYFDFDMSAGEEAVVNFSQPVNLMVIETFHGGVSSVVSGVPGEPLYRFVAGDGNDLDNRNFSSPYFIHDTLESVVLTSDPVSFRLHAYAIPNHYNYVVTAGISDSGVSRVISRSSWGADENLRIYYPKEIDLIEETEENGSEGKRTNICAPIERAFPNEFRQLSYSVDTYMGKDLIWPIHYSEKVYKIVVHHTASSPRDINEDGWVDAKDYAMQVRGIYNFHTVTRGWGDVGYNFIIDPQGNIYEGRAGRAKGKMSVGAHVLCQNTGTIGIALLGNFNNEHVTSAQRTALSKLIADLSKEYDIDPFGSSSFRGVTLPNVVGHSEIGSITKKFIDQGATSCPGTYLSATLSQIVAEVRNYFVKDYDIVFENLPQVLSLTPGDFDVEWELRFRNFGTRDLKNAVVKLSNGFSAPVGDVKAGQIGSAVFSFDAGVSPYSKKVSARVYSETDKGYKIIGRTPIFEIERNEAYVEMKGKPQVIIPSALYLGGRVEGALRYPIKTNANLAAGRFVVDPGNSLSRLYISNGKNIETIHPTDQYLDVPVVFDISASALAKKNASVNVRLRAGDIKVIGGRAGNVVDVVKISVNRPDLSRERLQLFNRVSSLEFKTGETKELRFEIATSGIPLDVLENLTDGDLVLKLTSSSDRLKPDQEEIPLALDVGGRKLIATTSVSSRYPVSGVLEGALYFGSQKLRDFSGRISGFFYTIKIQRNKGAILPLRDRKSE